MAICKKCGATIEDGQTICPQCGEPVAVQSEAQSAVLDSEKTAENTPLAAEDSLKSNPELEGKTSQKTKIIGIIVACCAVLLIACGFAAKTYFARDLKMLFMGDKKYMQSLEGVTAEAFTNQAVDAFGTVIQQLPTKNNTMAADFKSNMRVDLSSSFKDQLKQQLGGKEAILDKTMNYINSLSMEGSGNFNNQQMQSNIAVKDKSGKLFTMNMFLDKNGKYIYQMPEISKTYFVMESMAGVPNPVSCVSNLSFDSGKMKTSMRALTKPYVDAVQNGKITVQKNQSLKVEGLTVNNAAKISVTFTEEQLNQIMKQVLEAAKKDDYLYSYISGSSSSLSASGKMSKEEYQKMIDSSIEQLGGSAKTKRTLTVSAYVLSDDTQVARSYEFNNGEKASKATVNFVFQQKQYAVNTVVDNIEYLTAKLAYTTANSGVMQISYKDPEKSEDIGLKLDFSNVKKAQFAGKDTLLGTFSLSLTDPKNSLQNLITSSVGQNEWTKDLAKSTLKLENTMKGDKFSSECTLDMKGLATIKMASTSTPKTSSAVTVPSVKEGEALKLDANETDPGQVELQKKFTGDFLNYLSTQLDKDKELAELLQEVGINKSVVDLVRAQVK